MAAPSRLPEIPMTRGTGIGGIFFTANTGHEAPRPEPGVVHDQLSGG